MLWQKAWLESRGRFGVGVAATAAATAYAWSVNRFGVPRLTFIACCFLFGMGGLLREHALGTATFTLALPVGRLRLVAARAAVGWLELAAIAALPALFMASPLLSYLLWVAGGSALFAVALLASCVFGGEYTAFIVAWTVFFGHTLKTQYVRLMRPALRPYLYTVQEIMSRLRPFPPTLAIAILAGVSGALVAAAALVTRRRDF